MSVPIIYVFRGWEPYLEMSVQQTIRFNPDSPIYHVTSPNSRIATGAIGIDDSKFQTMAERFRSVYRHMGFHTYEFELFCFQRWMVSYELMEHLGIEQAILMDGDVLLWTAMSPLLRLFDRYGLSWVHPDQPGTIFVTNRETLRELCEFMQWHYENEEGFTRLTNSYQHRIATNQPAVITDMELLLYFYQAHPDKIGDNGSIVDGGRIDHNMMESDGYEMSEGLKKFIWRDGIPYARKLDDNSLVKFYSMHFIGKSKGYMDLFAKEKNLTTMTKISSLPKWIRARLPSVIRKIKDKLTRNK